MDRRMQQMTEIFAYFVIMMVSSTSSDMAGSCDMAGFYLELGCTPVAADNSTCPESFTCPDLHPDPESCYYRGLAYGNFKMIPQKEVNNPCSQSCFCRVSGKPQFECAAVDCVETFDSDMEEQCITTYELDSCCSTGSVCGKDAIAKLKTCEIDGKTYMEGQEFYPKDTRRKCICTAQWNGSVDNNAYCRDINCGIEIHYQAQLLESCAPVFAENPRTCPITFQCMTPTSRVVRGVNPRSVGAQCTFSNMTLSVGDELTTDDNCVSCACAVPPFVTCSRKTSC